MFEIINKNTNLNKTIRTNTIISKSINIKKNIHSYETHANLHKSITNNENE